MLYTAEGDVKVSDLDIDETNDITRTNGTLTLNNLEIEFPNKQGEYYGWIRIFNTKDDSNEDSEASENFIWNPPCYLEVLEFSKDGQEHNLPMDKVAIDLKISLAHHGDNACVDQSALVSIWNGATQTFSHKLSATDIQSAIQSSFDFTVIVPSNEVSSAHLSYDDSNADEASAYIDPVYVPEIATECAIEIKTFCLTGVSDLVDGRATFTFDMSVVASPLCQSLTASLDIVNDAGVYLGNVSLD